MKSSWIICCEGRNSAIILKKLARLWGRKPIDPELDRILLGGDKLEMVDFFIDHPAAQNWNELVMDTLALSAKFQPTWSIQIYPQTLCGSYVPKATGQDPRISGLRSALWQINADQTLLRQKWRPTGLQAMW